MCVYCLFLVKFQLKREQEIKTCLLCCRLHMRRVNTSIWMQAGNETTQTSLPMYQHHQRPVCKSKITWIQVFVLARHKLWRFLVRQQRISRLHVVMKKKSFTIFLSKLSCQSSNFRWKLAGLFFLRFPGGNEKFAVIVHLATRFYALGFAPHASAPTWACLQAIIDVKIGSRTGSCFLVAVISFFRVCMISTICGYHTRADKWLVSN